MDIHLRRIKKHDIPRLVRIENLCFADPWTNSTFVDILSCYNIRGLGALNNHNELIGYLIYAMSKRSLHIENIAVLPDKWRTGIGTVLVRGLKLRLSRQDRKRITLCVREHNVRSQLFFKSLGFIATKIDKSYYEDEDAIRFTYCKQPYILT